MTKHFEEMIARLVDSGRYNNSIIVACIAAALTLESRATTLITFDDITFAFALDASVPNGYEGLDWTNLHLKDPGGLFLYNPPGHKNGWLAGTVSPSNVVDNGWGDPAYVSSALPFNLNSAYLTSATKDELPIEVVGSRSGIVIYDHTYTVNVNAPTLVTFDYLGVDSVAFISTSPDEYTSVNPNSRSIGYTFVMDNLSVSAASPIPEPPFNLGASVILLLPIGIQMIRTRK